MNVNSSKLGMIKKSLKNPSSIIEPQSRGLTTKNILTLSERLSFVVKKVFILALIWVKWVSQTDRKNQLN